jgi:hypothetical protein
LSEEVEMLAREIAGPGASAEMQGHARPVADAQLDLCRVRYARHRCLANALSELNDLEIFDFGAGDAGPVRDGSVAKRGTVDGYGPV